MVVPLGGLIVLYTMVVPLAIVLYTMVVPLGGLVVLYGTVPLGGLIVLSLQRLLPKSPSFLSSLMLGCVWDCESTKHQSNTQHTRVTPDPLGVAGRRHRTPLPGRVALLILNNT